MTILINAASVHLGGGQTYLKKLCQWLPRAAPRDTFVVYAPDHTCADLEQFASGGAVQYESFPFGQTNGISRLYFDQVEVPRLIRKHKCDLLYSVTGFGTFICPCPQMLLLCNTIYFDMVYHRKYRESGRNLRSILARRLWALQSIKSADLILFPSQAMRDLVKPYCHLENKKTAVIHYGFDRQSYSDQAVNDVAAVHQVSHWRDEGYKILLSVSTYSIQKNFETVVEAIGILQKNGIKVKYIITIPADAAPSQAAHAKLLGRIVQLGLEEWVICVGHIPYEQIHALYQLADLFIFPSFTESFGLPMVEALEEGLPILAAATPINQEICGEAARFFDTFDAQDCASKIAELVQDEEARHNLIMAAKARAGSVSWREYAENVYELCKNLVGKI